MAAIRMYYTMTRHGYKFQAGHVYSGLPEETVATLCKEWVGRRPLLGDPEAMPAVPVDGAPTLPVEDDASVDQDACEAAWADE